MSVVMKKVKRKKRVMTEEQRQKKRECDRKYFARPEIKAKRKKYNARPEVTAKRKEYFAKNKQKKREYERKYYARPGAKARKRERVRKYCARPEAKARKREQQRRLMRKRLENPMLGPKIREQMRKYIASKQALCCICLSVRTGAGACKDCFAKVQGGDHVSIEAFVRCALEHKFPGAEFCTKTRLGGVDWCVVRCYCPPLASFVHTPF